jgi:hypothetical protein
VIDPRIPIGPLEQEPAGPFIPHDERAKLLENALGRVLFGTFDRHIIGWLAGWDAPTLRTVASLIVRARQAEAAVADELAGLRRYWGADPPLLTRPHDWPPDRE